MKNIIILFLVFIAVMVPLYVIEWQHHTTQVQSLVKKDFERFKTRDITWLRVDITSDPTAVLKDTQVAIIKISSGWRVAAFRTQQVAYIQSMYDLIKTLVNQPDDHLTLLKQRNQLIQAQQQYYDAVEKFIDNKFYAMRYTM
jgi:type IV secretory pathway protease TraF